MSRRATIVSDSIEYLRVKVSAIRNGQEYDPTGDAVSFAFCPAENFDAVPDGLTFYSGSWESGESGYYAQFLYGDTLTLAKGKYIVLVKIDAEPEHPVKKAGIIQIV